MYVSLQEKREKMHSADKFFLTDSQIKEEKRKAEHAYYYIITHQRIFEASEVYFMNEKYRSAILDAFIEFENMVKEKANYPKDNKGRELIGVNLMRRVFNPNQPILRWNPLQTQWQQDEYEGYSHIFAGVMLGIRNPKAHRRFQQTPMRALHLLVIANLLAEIVDICVNVERERT